MNYFLTTIALLISAMTIAPVRAATEKTTHVEATQLPAANFPTQTMEIYTIDDNLVFFARLCGLPRSSRSDKQALGFILPPNTSFRVRQINPNFVGDTWWRNYAHERPMPNGAIGIDLFTHARGVRRQNIEVPNDGEWVVISAHTNNDGVTHYTVPLVRTPFVPMGATERPVIEFEIIPNAPNLPVYNYTDSRTWIPGVNDDFTTAAAWDAWNTPEARRAHEEFVTNWTNQPYALIRGHSLQILVSINDRYLPVTVQGPDFQETREPFFRGNWDVIANLRHFSNLDQVLGYFDHMHAKFDYWFGFDPAQPRWRHYNIWPDSAFYVQDPRHVAPATMYFAAPHAGGPGAGYWAGTHMGQSSMDGSIEGFYLRRGWAGLHEVGHSYQAKHFWGILGEVWVNLPAHFYQVAYIIPNHPLTPFPWHDPAFSHLPGWIGGGLEASRAQVRSDQANFENTVGTPFSIFSSLFFDSNCNYGNQGAFRGRHNASPRLHHQRVNNGVTYFSGSITYRLYFYTVLIEAIGGMENGFREFNRMYREWFSTDKMGVRAWSDYNVHALFFSLASGYNFVPYFEVWGVEICDVVKSQTAHLPAMYILYDRVSDAATRAMLVERFGLASEYSLISASALVEAGVE